MTIVLHLTSPPSNNPARDQRRFAAAVAAGVVLVAGAILRVASGGQTMSSLFVALLLAVAIILLLFAYAWLRIHNASVFFDNGRIGVTNALGIRRDVPVTSVDHIQVTTPIGPNFSSTLVIVRREGRGVIKFRGADRLNAIEIQRLAEIAGIPLQNAVDLDSHM